MEECCPACQAVWTMEEIDLGCCYCCGYPDDDEGELDWDDEHDHG